VKDMRDYLRQRAAELGLERGDQLVEIQAHLDELYPGMCRAVSLNDGVLKITAANSSMASELRMRQVGLKDRLNVANLIIGET
jgi:hypothetical protein